MIFNSNAVATAYGITWTTDGQQHPFIETFRPNIFVVNGMATVCFSSALNYLYLKTN